MSTRLAHAAQQVLSEVGLEVVASSTGDRQNGTINLIDPSSYNLVQARLSRQGINCSRRTAATVDLHLPKKAGRLTDELAQDEADFDNLVASWRKFAEHSSDIGYRKAARSLRAGFNQIEAARQIGEATIKMSSKSPFLRRIGMALRKAANARDVDGIKKLLGRLTAGPMLDKPIFKNPRAPYEQQEEDVDLFATPTASVRKADAEGVAFNSAQRFIMDYANQKKMGADDVARLASNPGKAMDAWKQTVPVDLPANAMDAGWVDAATAVASQLKTETRRAATGWMGAEDGLDTIYDNGVEDYSNHGFVVSRAMDKKYDADSIRKIVGRIIEHYVVDQKTGEPQHPTQITTAQIRNYLRKNEPAAPLKPVISYLNQVTNRIPNRNEERGKQNAGRAVIQASPQVIQPGYKAPPPPPNPLRDKLYQAIQKKSGFPPNRIKGQSFTSEYFSSIGMDVPTLMKKGVIQRDPEGNYRVAATIPIEALQVTPEELTQLNNRPGPQSHEDETQLPGPMSPQSQNINLGGVSYDPENVVDSDQLHHMFRNGPVQQSPRASSRKASAPGVGIRSGRLIRKASTSLR